MIFDWWARYVIKPDGVVAQQAGNRFGFKIAMSPISCIGFGMLSCIVASVISSPLWLYLSSKAGKYYTWWVDLITSPFAPANDSTSLGVSLFASG